MSGIFTFVFAIWFLGAVISSPYFWAKKVDRSLPPIARRFLALGYGFTWPYLVATSIAANKNSGSGSAGSTGPSAQPLATNPYRTKTPPSAPPRDNPPAANPFRD